MAAPSSRTFVFDSAREFDRDFEETFYSTDDSYSNLSSTDTSSESPSSSSDSDDDASQHASRSSQDFPRGGSDNGFYRPQASVQPPPGSASYTRDERATAFYINNQQRYQATASSGDHQPSPSPLSPNSPGPLTAAANENTSEDPNSGGGGGGTQRFVRAFSRVVIEAAHMLSPTSDTNDDNLGSRQRRQRRRRGIEPPASRSEEHRERFRFLARRAQRERTHNDSTVIEEEEAGDGDEKYLEVEGGKEQFTDDEEDVNVDVVPVGRSSSVSRGSTSDARVLFDDMEDDGNDGDDEAIASGYGDGDGDDEEDEVIVTNGGSAEPPKNSIFRRKSAEVMRGSGGENNKPYGIPGENAHEYQSTHAFPVIEQEVVNEKVVPSTDGDVVIEEPERDSNRRHRRHAKQNGGSEGGAGGDGGAEDEHGNRRKKTRKRRKSHRRYSASMASAAAARRRAGWEPGVDIRTTDVILQSIGSCVTIVDYNGSRYRIVQTEVLPEHHPDGEEEEDGHTPGSAPLYAQWWQNSAQTTPGVNGAPSSRVDEQNKDFYDHLDNRPEWSSVRWISVNGLSWETISAISQRYQLHRLAIEDMIDIPQRTKVDMYPTHTFCVLPLHKLISYKPDDSSEQAKRLRWFRKSAESNGTTTGGNSSRVRPIRSRVSTMGRRRDVGGSGFISDDGDSDSSTASSDKPLSSQIAEMPTNTIYDWNNPYVASLKKPVYIEKKRPLAAYRRAVGVEQVSLFLTDQQTVISFFEHSAVDIERPLLARLSTKSTMLRESCDPSMLLQAIIDIIVDQAQPIITAYRRRLTELEMDVMVMPNMSHTQDLHLMAAELSLLRNNIVPITSLIQSLRDHTQSGVVGNGPVAMEGGVDNIEGGDNEKEGEGKVGDNSTGTAAVLLSTSTGSSSSTVHEDNNSYFGNSRISAVAKVYLADVSDHLLSYTQDLDLMRNNTKNMIDMIFNTISIQSSDGVKQLSLVTVVFMPLSFWTGYFGMNFENFTLLEAGTPLYWKIAVPFAFGVLLLVMVTSVLEWYRHLKRYVRKSWVRHQRKVSKRLMKRAKKKMEMAVV
ncbi:uncharacterized protein SAPINGB_P003457 [Magnusiomyces paraingens]|uniref:Uncharacterized protein n=1 Tax=Magnusiomyces paraingens TaxID=2606893 RepID=A0A5E8BUX6_9ASCO|nr:uncharacterized protein SAPINGB_P003457 [Saprochaete ingens]VVT53207.1 unnamed protein product [Saprochaete ingens]